MEFYQTTKWRHLREVILRRDGYQCQISKRYGKHRQAENVHHIFPREFFPEYTYAAWNLVSVSTKTHNRLHDRDTHKLTEEGWNLLVRTARQNNIELKPGLKEFLTQPPT